MKTLRTYDLRCVYLAILVITRATPTSGEPAQAVQFARITEGTIVTEVASSIAGAWVDFNQDGWVDLFVANFILDPSLDSKNFLYRNNGDGSFSRLTESEIGDLAVDPGDSSGGFWADYDNDGDLDVYVANWSLDGSGDGPGKDVFYVNDGSGRFTRINDNGLDSNDVYSAAGALGDYDNDGFVDLLIITAGSLRLNHPPTPNFLFRNQNGLSFELALETVGTKSNSGSWADYDGDGDLDFLILNWDNNSSNRLYQNQGGDGLELLSGRGLPTATSYDGAWGDFDRDGDLDVVMGRSTGTGILQLYENLGDGQFDSRILHDEDLGPAQGLGSVTWLDANNDGRLDVFASPGTSTRDHVLLLQEVDGTFERTVIPATGNRWSAAWGDMDNDGFLDLYVAQAAENAEDEDGGANALWRNIPNANHWLKLQLKGTSSNRSGIGAIVRVRATIDGESVWQMRQVTVGGTAYVQHDIRPNFGLGDATVAEIVRIEWPSGVIDEFRDVAVGQILEVTESPKLEIQKGVVLSWPITEEPFVVEGADSLDGPWILLDLPVSTMNGELRIIVEATERMKFYRLQKAAAEPQ